MILRRRKRHSENVQFLQKRGERQKSDSSDKVEPATMKDAAKSNTTCAVQSGATYFLSPPSASFSKQQLTDKEIGEGHAVSGV